MKIYLLILSSTRDVGKVLGAYISRDAAEDAAKHIKVCDICSGLNFPMIKEIEVQGSLRVWLSLNLKQVEKIRSNSQAFEDPLIYCIESTERKLRELNA